MPKALSTPPSRPRAALSRGRVLQAAVELVDELGIGALTMRRLATRLGVEPMSLYNHVANKEDLLDGIVDAALAEIELPPPDVDWKTAMRIRSRSHRDVLRRHSWALTLLESRTNPSDVRLTYYDSVLGSLRRAGFSIADSTHVFATLDSFVYGYALQESSLPFGDAAELAEVGAELVRFIPPERFPWLHENAQHALATGFDFADEFDHGLELILDAFERRLGD